MTNSVNSKFQVLNVVNKNLNLYYSSPYWLRVEYHATFCTR